MLAHSMEHVAQRHATREATRGQIANRASIPLIFVVGWSGGCSEAISLPVGFLAMHRNDELEADALAVQTIARAGLDPGALERYIGRTQTQPTGVFSLLPSRDQRVAAMHLVCERLPVLDYEVTSGEFFAIQQEVIRLTEHRESIIPPPTLKRH